MDVQMHDGSHLRIRKLDRDYDPTDRLGRLAAAGRSRGQGRSADRRPVCEHQQADFPRTAEPDGGADRDSTGVQGPAVQGRAGPGDGRVTLDRNTPKYPPNRPNLGLISRSVRC